jgi:hypothetical protein
MNIESYQYLNVSRSRCQLNSKLEDLAQRVCHSPGCKLPLGTLFGLSIATGVLSSPPQYALAERDQPEKYWIRLLVQESGMKVNLRFFHGQESFGSLFY